MIVATVAARLLPDTRLHKPPALRTDDLPINRLFQAIEARLREAKLHLIGTILPLQFPGVGAAGISSAETYGGGRRRIGLNHGR